MEQNSTKFDSKEKTLELCVTLLYIIARRTIIEDLNEEDMMVVQFCEAHLHNDEFETDVINLANNLISSLYQLKEIEEDKEKNQTKYHIQSMLPEVQKASEERGWQFRPTVDELDANIPNLEVLIQ